jgi:hypothetical protein
MTTEAYADDVRLGSSMSTDGVLEFLVREAVPRFKARSGEAAEAGATA